MVLSDKQLESYLIENRLIPRSVIASALNRSAERNEPLAQSIVSLSILTSDEMRRVISEVGGMRFIKLSADDIEFADLSLIPEPFSRRHSLISYKSQGNIVEVAALTLPLPDLSFIGPNKRILVRLTDEKSMRLALVKYQRYLKKYLGEKIAREAQRVQISSTSSVKKEEFDNQAVQNLAYMLFKHAITCYATDIHFDLQESNFLVRYRIGRFLYQAMQLSPQVGNQIISHLKNLVTSSSKSLQQSSFKLEGLESEIISVSLSSINTIHGERIVLHLTKKHTGGKGFSLESLGFQGQAIQRTHDALSHASGLILVCSLPDQGKSTTLYTLIDLLTNPEKNIIVLGTNFPKGMSFVQKVDINTKDVSSTLTALRVSLLQDPDILAIDHLENEEVASIALEAANRGVLILSTFAASSAVEGIRQLMNICKPEMVAAVLKSSIGISRVRNLCSDKETYQPTSNDLRIIENISNPVKIMTALKNEGLVDTHTAWKNLSLSREKDCQKCEGGYIGHIGIQEVLPSTHTLKRVIEQNGSSKELTHHALTEGMLTLGDDVVYKSLQGLTTLDEARKMAQAQ